MWNWILNLFGKSNDWIIVWSEQGLWTIEKKSNDNAFDISTENKACMYDIQFSKSLNKYRLIKSGYKSEDHAMLLIANMRLIKYNKDLK